MLTADTRSSNPLTVSDLAPVRRMLGAHSMVIRVSEDGGLMPFEIMPELFLGRSIRRLLTTEVRERFEATCRRVVATATAAVFALDGADERDEVMITPVFDDHDADRCRFLVCWARRGADIDEPSLGDPQLGWHDLEIGAVEVRFRALGGRCVEAAPWWAVGDEGVALWDHHHHVSSLGLATGVMELVVIEAIPVLVDHDDTRLRIDVPAPDMLNGLLQILHGTIRATGVDPSRVELGVPVEMAVDHDLLPLIVHLRTLGLQIDIVGLDALTAKLRTVSDRSDHPRELPSAPPPMAVGAWTTDPTRATRDAA